MSSGTIFFSNPLARSFPLVRDGFRLVNQVKSPRKIAFIDGRNQEIVGAPNFSVQVNRLCFAMWVGDERRSEKHTPRRLEFFSTIFSNFRNGEIYYDTLVIPTQKEQAVLLPDEDRSLLKT